MRGQNITISFNPDLKNYVQDAGRLSDHDVCHVPINTGGELF